MPTVRRSDLGAQTAFRLGAGQRIVADGRFAIRTAGANGFLAAGEAGGAFLRSLGEALKADQIQRHVAEANDRLAKEARAAVIRAYASRNPRRHIQPYRVGSGRVGYGLIERALADSGHEGLSTRFKVQPFDFDLLDRLTRLPGSRLGLWRQINFGALPNSGKKPKSYAVALNGGSGFVLQLENDPVPAGVLKRPLNRWRDASGEFVPPHPNGDDEFVPGRARGGEKRLVPLKGSRATQFMDAAPRTIARRFGPIYSEMYGDVLADARKRTRLGKAGVYVPKNLGNVRQPQFFVVSVR